MTILFEIYIERILVFGRYGTPGCVSSVTTPTSGPPVFDQDPSSSSPYKKKHEEFINIDSGFEGNYR